HRMTWLNSRGLEWRNDIYLGQQTGWVTELYQPLDLARLWFVAPVAQINQQAFDLFNNDQAVARYLVREAGVGLTFGRRIGPAAEVRLGYLYGTVHAHTNIGVPSFPDVSVKAGALTANFVLDRLDNWAFPTEGSYVSGDYRYYSQALGSELD